MSNPSTISTLVLRGGQKEKQSCDFNEIRLSLASTEQVKSWSHGEVTKPETINYRSRKPERDGLFCQKIFGPVKDWQCACGKYKKLRYKGIVCDRCGVEVTRSLVRRERFGHIDLAAPVAHIWFLRSLPSKIGLVLKMSISSLEKVIYFANFVITEVKEDLKNEFLEKLEKEYKEKKKELQANKADEDILALADKYKETRKEIMDLEEKKLLTEFEYRELSLKYGHIFSADIGAEAVFKLLAKEDLSEIVADLEKTKKAISDVNKKKKIVQRIKYLRSFMGNNIKPEDMILRVIPVIPPELRPLVPLDGGRFASSDLNDLYRRVINRNNRLKRLYELKAPEVILRNEKRMLQEAVDALFDNNMRSGKTVIASTGQRRSLKSLADILKGKQGRFRQNLLGKRVDYSGRSVIVVGPKLKLDQCGLPKVMALELFKPFIASQLIKKGLVHNVRSANRTIEQKTEDVWAILEEIIKDAYVLLNRAPTLHRLGIQGFRPVLVEGKAIQIHPLVCTAFNADFDGDTMSVHVPITDMAKKEVENIILSTNNLLKPATGGPVITPTKDMVWGSYYLTFLSENNKKDEELKAFSSTQEAILAYEMGKIDLQEKIKVQIDNQIKVVSVGRLIFNSIFPPGIYKMDQAVDKKVLGKILSELLEQVEQDKAVKILDKIKEYGFKYLTDSGLSFGIKDLPQVKGKDKIIKESEDKIREIKSQYEMGLLADDERYLKTIEAWIDTKDKVTDLVQANKPIFSPVFSMVESGARGSWSQFVQMVGMRGIVRSPSGKLIELPIKSSLKEGYNILEYFISSHGSRKGSSDTALRTAKAGYLTRRMVDLSQDVLVVEEDCGDKKGLVLTREENEEMVETWENRLFGRTSAQDFKDPKTKKVIIKEGEIIDRNKARAINAANPDQFAIYSVLTCKSLRGVCSKCYGYDLAYNKKVKVGVPVGVVAAQSIGEPGTQLTLRTFHTGGVADTDITQGLPRVEELFEARASKGQAFLAPADGKVSVIDNDEEKKIIFEYQTKKKEIYHFTEKEGWKIKVKAGQEVQVKDILAEQKGKKILAKHNGLIEIDSQGNIILNYSVDAQEEFDASNRAIWTKDQKEVKAGEQLTDGSLDLQELYRLCGKREVEKYILREVQHIYSSQGQKLNDKHIEVVIKQMFSRCLIKDSGDTELFPGEIVPKSYFLEANQKIKSSQEKAVAQDLLLGITKVSLSTDSWLSAASFQQTSRVLVDTAINGRPDYLRGLKENVIVGRLIPAGTGLRE
jgi:DNA-directed RNA polymerase subunit beta'